MHPTGTKFKTKDGKKWEIISRVYANNFKDFLYYYCVCRGGKNYEFKNFTESKLEGVEFY